jgi:methyl-accepting chemotaxis protein
VVELELDRVRESVDSEIAACAERVRGLLAEATGLSEREVMAAGERIGAVKAEAREHLEALQVVARTFESGGRSAKGNLGASIAAQSRTVDELISRLQAGYAVQRDAAGSVAAAAVRIDKFVNVIGDIATGLHVLTLNARIEAARRGAQGAAFATIADSMRSLATDVQQANYGIGTLSSDLTASAGAAQEVNATMHVLLEQAKAQIAKDLGHLLEAFQGAQGTTEIAARQGVERAQRLVSLTDDLLSHLQFQDRMAQVLAEANANLETTRAVTNELLARAATEDVENVVRDLRSRRKTSTVRLSGESELASSDLSMESGVVMMF